MSLENLQKWLVEEGIRKDLDVITRMTVRSELDNFEVELPATSDESKLIDWHRLLLAGSILARSKLRSDQEAALRIATAAISLTSENTLKDAGAVLLGKLSNFRAVLLATDRNLVDADLDSRLGIGLRLEAQHRELSSSVLVQSSGSWIQVNDFQQRFWGSGACEGWLSASAATASGKTFLVLQW